MPHGLPKVLRMVCLWFCIGYSPHPNIIAAAMKQSGDSSGDGSVDLQGLPHAHWAQEGTNSYSAQEGTIARAISVDI